MEIDSSGGLTLQPGIGANEQAGLTKLVGFMHTWQMCLNIPEYLT